MIDNLAREVLFHKIPQLLPSRGWQCVSQRGVGLDVATNDGNASGLSFDCQIFAVVICGSNIRHAHFCAHRDDR
jgi:hypothetical protein